MEYQLIFFQNTRRINALQCLNGFRFFLFILNPLPAFFFQMQVNQNMRSNHNGIIVKTHDPKLFIYIICLDNNDIVLISRSNI